MAQHESLKPLADAQTRKKSVNLTDMKIDRLLNDLLTELLGLWQNQRGYHSLEEKIKMSKKICNFISAFENKKKG